MEPIIAVRELVNQFGSQRVHDGLSMDVERGEIVGIVGGSGTGKSVLLRSILGLHNPTSGTITVLGVDIRYLQPLRETGLEITRALGSIDMANKMATMM